MALKPQALFPIVVKCTKRHTWDSVNGPLTKVTVTPDGPFNTTIGSLTFFVHDEEDLAAYQVGKRFRLVPEILP